MKEKHQTLKNFSVNIQINEMGKDLLMNEAQIMDISELFRGNECQS